VAAAGQNGGEITPITPDRFFDNRPTGTKIQPNAVIDPQIQGARPSIPAGTTAILANVTIDQPSAAGFLTVFPNAGAVPDTSNLNFDAGDTIPNLVLARLGSDGKIRIANVSPQNNNAANIIVDVFAAFTPNA
jgi:hypothetical protein